MLIVFVKNPILGQVKTRLAKDLGEAQALAAYEALLDLTAACLRDWDRALVQIHYGDFVPETDARFRGFERLLQEQSPDLGLRMHEAFSQAFAKGHERVLIIGSDCPDMNPALLNLAWDMLGHRDLVIGPAEDGGYYLLGLRQPQPQVLLNRTWSHERVFEEAMDSIEALGLSHFVLPKLYDVDNLTDWQRWQAELNK